MIVHQKRVIIIIFKENYRAVRNLKSKIKITMMGPALSFTLLTVLLPSCAVDGDPSLPVIPLPGIIVKPTSGLLTTEVGGTDNFMALADSGPEAEVTNGIYYNDTTDGKLIPNSLVFTVVGNIQGIYNHPNEEIVGVDGTSKHLDDLNLESVEMDSKSNLVITSKQEETEKLTVELVNSVKISGTATVPEDKIELTTPERKVEIAKDGTKEVLGKGVLVEMTDTSNNIMVGDGQYEGVLTIEKEGKNQDISLIDGVMMLDSEGETTTWNEKNPHVEDYGLIVSTDNSDRFNDIFKDEYSINKFLRKKGTFYKYLGESRENIIGLYVNTIDFEAGINVFSDNVYLLQDGTKKLIPLSYSIFVGRVIPPIKPENAKSKQIRITPDANVADIFESIVYVIERDYGNIGVRADIGRDSYLTAKFNPFTNEACTYVKLKKTLYNEEGGKIADVSVKGVATYYIEENAWSAKVNAQVKVPFGF
jgi:hypothetical protein